MSHSEFIEKPILTRIKEHDEIKSICDLGSGYGMWGLLLRIQNDFNYTIDAVDLYEPWLNRLGRLNIYNSLYHSDVIKFLENPIVYAKYDLFLCCELVEHLKRVDGLRLIESLKKAKKVIISTPYIKTKKLKKNKGFWAGNDLCFHSSGYTSHDFKDYNVELIRINYIPRYFKPFLRVRERLIGKTYSEYNILAHRGI